MQNRHVLGLLGVVSILTACTTTSTPIPSEKAFIVQGVSGQPALVDRLWDQGCIPGGGGKGSWMHSKRTLTGLELVTTVTDYQNNSTTPDCTNGRSMVTTTIQKLSKDTIRVPLTWVDEMLKPAAAPSGLEGVTQANGAIGVLTLASRTVETQLQADQLNAEAFCSFTDWKPGVAKNLLSCFPATGKGAIVVDDRTTPWKIYDGIGDNPEAYPNFMPNYSPHLGPF